LRASAYANLETGLPIYIHTYPWSRASLEAVDILTSEGVRPDQICICHLDVEFDYDYLCRVFDKGVYAMFDNFGKEYYFPKQDAVFSGGPFETDLDRVRMIIRMIQDKHTDRLMLATDVCLKSLLHSYGGWSYDHIFTNIQMMMENEGVSLEDIDTILMKNPVRFICSR
jgi:phosphotriesterase-related protein